MNMASSAAPKPNPSSTLGALALNHSTTTAAPNSPRTTVNMPATPPVRNAIRIAECSPHSLAPAATRTLPRTVSDIPANTQSAENSPPTTQNADQHQLSPVVSAGS